MNFRSIGKFLLQIFDGNFMFQAGMFQADPGKFKRSQKNKEKVEDYPLKNTQSKRHGGHRKKEKRWKYTSKQQISTSSTGPRKTKKRWKTIL